MDEERKVGDYVLIESRSYGDLYGDVPSWGNALSFMRDTLKLPVRRVATTTWCPPGRPVVESPCVYFENKVGFEIGCWTEGMNRLQVFAPRPVHEIMRANKTLWTTTSEVVNNPEGLSKTLGITKTPTSLLSTPEQLVVSRLAGAWNAFVRLESVHPDETTEFRRAVHAAQHIVMARPVQRQFNVDNDALTGAGGL